jgi:pimeloyl-ACP methyl ester carboxylesterase
VREQCLEVIGTDNLVRRGIIGIPKNNNREKIAVAFIPAGLKYHVGPNRFYVWLSRELSARGYYAIRFDPIGVGDSDGRIESGTIRSIWQTIEKGRFVKDTKLVCETIRKEYDISKIILCGICGGAITSQLTAANTLDLISGVISINTAVTLSNVDVSATEKVSQSQIQRNFGNYIKKAGSVQAWKRVIVGETNYKNIKNTIMAKVKSSVSMTNKQNEKEYVNNNPEFMRSFNKLIELETKHLLIFGENDNRWFEFQDRILQGHLNNKLSANTYTIETIPNANHELHWKEWKIMALRHIGKWLEGNF